jgi:exonuclease SbcD
MKILHTADWHLGRYLHNFPLIDEQRFILEQVMQIVREEQPDVVIIAGDVYDRSVPPAEAVTLFDQTIKTIVGELGTKVIAIAGNHDSPERIHCHSSLLSLGGFYVYGQHDVSFQPIVLKDEFGEVNFYPVPFIEPDHARYLSSNPDIKTHDDVWQWICDEIQKQESFKNRSVMIAHLFAAGGEVCESERALSVGGADQVSVGKFDIFNYTALGHLHCPQEFLKGKVAYSGSLLKYSLSEVSHPKSVSIVEIDGGGLLKTFKKPLIARKDVRTVNGKIDGRNFELLKDEKSDEPRREDYLHVLLENEEIVLNPMSLIQKTYPNTLKIEFPNRPAIISSARFNAESVAEMSPVELFSAFYETLTEKPLDAEREEILNDVLEEILKES